MSHPTTIIPKHAWYNREAGILYFKLPWENKHPQFRMRRFPITRNGRAICGKRRFS